MNKHAIAFVSTFALTLVLSVYYLMIPKGSDSTPINAGGSNIVLIEDAKSYYYEALKNERKSEYENTVSSLESQIVIATTNDVKNELLNKIDDLKFIYEQEMDAEEELEEIGYPESFVRIIGNKISVIVTGEDNQSEAVKVIMKVKKVIPGDYQVFVEFKK